MPSSPNQPVFVDGPLAETTSDPLVDSSASGVKAAPLNPVNAGMSGTPALVINPNNTVSPVSAPFEELPLPKKPLTRANSIPGAVVGSVLGAITSVLIHNPITCFVSSLRAAEWKQWGPMNIFRVLASPIVNPLLAVVDGLVEGGAMGFRGGMGEATRVPAEVWNKAPFSIEGKPITDQAQEREMDSLMNRTRLPVVVVHSDSFSMRAHSAEVGHHEATTKFGRFFQLSARLETSSEKQMKAALAKKQMGLPSFDDPHLAEKHRSDGGDHPPQFIGKD